MTIAHLYPNGNVERGTATPRKPRPGYRWVPAYSQVLWRGERDPRIPYNPEVALIDRKMAYSQPLPRRDWYALAQRDGFKCKFHISKEAAIAALKRGE
jgi:hypothetical protein